MLDSEEVVHNQLNEDAARPSRASLRARVAFALRVVQVRLRFIVVLIAIFAVIALWKHVSQLADWAITRLTGGSARPESISPDTEYFCPMCPGVLSNWPDKCSVCKMPLVRRRKGDATLLPEGVLARMQLTPQRLQLAGVQTSEARYLALERDWQTPGVVETCTEHNEQITAPNSLIVVTRVGLEDLPFLYVGQLAQIVSTHDELDTVVPAQVTDVENVLDRRAGGVRVRLEIGSPTPLWPAGTLVNVTWSLPLAEIEPFQSMPRDPAPLTTDDVRDAYVCAEHPDYLHIENGKCPFDGKPLQPRALTANQRLEWHCPAHPETHGGRPATCADCSELPLVARIVSYSPSGQVLAIPDSAVIDTGDAQIAFVETGPGMFDAVALQVGPRVGAYRSIISGLEAGQRVVATGAFLLDAETRLTANLSAAYFGAGSGNSRTNSNVIGATRDHAPHLSESFGLAPEDAARASAQKTCPATGFALGSMGTPVRVRAGDHVVYLCCSACKSKVSGAADLPYRSSEQQPPAAAVQANEALTP